MAWWDRPLDAVRARLTGSAGVDDNPQRGPRAEATQAPLEAWRDVPPLQRTVAEPIQPVAINSGFRASLASFADPSFLAPLGHRVDPSVGGLVAGLVSPGRPPTREGPDLVVAQRAAAHPATRVQRLATWGVPGMQPPTVNLEFLHQHGPTASGDEPTELPEPPDASEPAVADATMPGAPHEPPSASPAPPAARTGPTAAPAPASAPGTPTPSSHPHVQRSPATVAGSNPLPPHTPGARSPAVDQPGDPPGLDQSPETSATSPAPQPDRVAELELELVTPEPPADDPSALLDLPVVGSTDEPTSGPRLAQGPAGPPSLQRSDAGVSPDAPTLGTRAASTALHSPATPLGQFVPRHDEPAVQ